jgi:hypothetical protein
MSISKVVAAAGGFMALLASVGAGRAAAEACKLGTELPVMSVSEYKRPVETGGYGGTVREVPRGADIRVAARPGLTAEWLERTLKTQVAMGECYFGPAASVDVFADAASLVVRVTGTYEGPGVTRLPERHPDDVAAREILRQARALQP